MSDQQETEYKIHTKHLVSFSWWAVCFVENWSLTVMKTWPWVLSLWVCSMHLWCVVEILRFIDKRATQHGCILGSSILWQKSTSVAWIFRAWKCHCTLSALLGQTASLLGVPFNCQKWAEYNIYIYITLFSEKCYPKRSLSSLKRLLCVVAVEILSCKWVTAVRITGFGLPEVHKRWTLILGNWYWASN